MVTTETLLIHHFLIDFEAAEINLVISGYLLGQIESNCDGWKWLIKHLLLVRFLCNFLQLRKRGSEITMWIRFTSD